MLKKASHRCLFACATTGGRFINIGSANNAGQYAHEFIHIVGFRHENFDPSSVMHGSFGEYGFKSHGIKYSHLDKLISEY